MECWEFAALQWDKVADKCIEFSNLKFEMSFEIWWSLEFFYSICMSSFSGQHFYIQCFCFHEIQEEWKGWRLSVVFDKQIWICWMWIQCSHLYEANMYTFEIIVVILCMHYWNSILCCNIVNVLFCFEWSNICF